MAVGVIVFQALVRVLSSAGCRRRSAGCRRRSAWCRRRSAGCRRRSAGCRRRTAEMQRRLISKHPEGANFGKGAPAQAGSQKTRQACHLYSCPSSSWTRQCLCTLGRAVASWQARPQGTSRRCKKILFLFICFYVVEAFALSSRFVCASSNRFYETY